MSGQVIGKPGGSGGGGGGSVNSVSASTGLTKTGTATDPILALSGASITSLGKADTAIQPGVASIVSADISATAAILKTQLAAAVQTSLGLADTALQTIVAGTLIAGTLASTVVSNAAAGATALQPGGNLTGTVNGVAVATVTSGAASGATAVQPNTSPTLSGLTVTGLNGVVKAAAGVLSAATVVDADVSASAAIAGTKVAPDFGSQDIASTGNLLIGAVGTARAATGAIRLANAVNICWRNGVNSGDLTAGYNSSNQFAISSACAIGGANGLVLGASSVAWASGATTPTISQTQNNTATATGAAMLINAQDMGGTTVVTAGKLTVRAGNCAGASGTRTGGAIDIAAGTGATAGGLGRILAGNGTVRMSWNDTGWAAFAATPVAQPSDLGAPSFSTVGDVQTYIASLRTNVLRPLGLTA